MDNGKKGGLNTTQKILIIGFICILAAIGAVAYFLLKKEAPAAETTGNSLLVDDSNLDDIGNQMAEAVADGMFEVNMNTIWNFPDSKSPSADAYVANGSANRYPVSFEILLDGTEQIYASPVIPVGKQIKEIKLEKELSAGTYEAVCMYHLWAEDGTENSSFGVNVTLNIAE